VRIKAKSFTIDGEADGARRPITIRGSAPAGSCTYRHPLCIRPGRARRRGSSRSAFLDRKAALAGLLRNTEAGILLNEHVAEDGAHALYQVRPPRSRCLTELGRAGGQIARGQTVLPARPLRGRQAGEVTGRRRPVTGRPHGTAGLPDPLKVRSKKGGNHRGCDRLKITADAYHHWRQAANAASEPAPDPQGIRYPPRMDAPVLCCAGEQPRQVR
jgi:hypothetical protein